MTNEIREKLCDLLDQIEEGFYEYCDTLEDPDIVTDPIYEMRQLLTNMKD